MYADVSSVDPLDPKFDICFFINQVNESKKYWKRRYKEVDEMGIVKPMTYAELRLVINRLKSNKTTFVDDVSAEFVQAGGDALIDILLLYYGVWCKLAVTPSKLCCGLIHLLFKSGGRDPYVVLSHRQLIIVPLLFKIMEGVLVIWVEKDLTLCQEQTAFTRNRGIADNITAMKSIMANHRQKKLLLIFFVLDAVQAFPKMWTIGAQNLAHKFDIHGRGFRLLSNLGTNMSNAVKVGQYVSKFKEFDQGSKTGSVSAPLIYKIYINNLILELKKLNIGVKLMVQNFWTIVAVLAYADDLLLIAENTDDATKMLKFSESYSAK